MLSALPKGFAFRPGLSIGPGESGFVPPQGQEIPQNLLNLTLMPVRIGLGEGELPTCNTHPRPAIPKSPVFPDSLPLLRLCNF